MTKRLHISADIALPLDAVTQTFAIIAKRRVGKTYTASVMAEEFLKAGLPFTILDPTGAWWGLRASSDGKRAGYPVTIIGGAHGDIPLEPTAGKVIAELVVEHPGFYVIDTSATESDAEQDRFATDFATRLYRLKEKHRDPMHLFVDEADMFAPQRPFPNQTRMLGAFEALVRRGGIRGIGVTLITQRPAVLNKNVFTQTECLIALQLTAPQDQDAIDDWVKRNGSKEQRDTMMASLASLKRGQAWVWSPAWLEMFKLIQVRERETFNSSATPKAGETVVTPKMLAPVDIEKLRHKIADTIERAKDNDPAQLKRRVAELQRQLAQRPVAAPAQPNVERVEVAVFRDGEVAQLEAAVSALSNTSAQLAAVGQQFSTAAQHINTAAAEVIQALRAAAARVNQPVAITSPKRPVARPAPSRAPIAQTESDGSVSRKQQDILDALAWLESVGLSVVDKTQLALLAGASPTSSTYGNNLGALRTAGLIEYPQSGKAALTHAGRTLARAPERPPTTADLQREILARISGKKADILRELIDAYPESLSREALAERAGSSVTSSTYGNNLGALRTLGLIDYPQPGHVVALPVLFIE